MPRNVTRPLAGNKNTPIPLCGVEQCQFKRCDNNKTVHKPYTVPDSQHLAKTDPYWSEFLKAQEQSTANYLYKMQIYGNNRDPTLVKKEPFPPELIRQRLLKMPIVGALTSVDMFYILSFMLNVTQLKTVKQKECMERFQDQGLVDNEILNYLQIVARHPNTGIPKETLKDFLELIHQLIQRASTFCNYFNPDHIFTKSMVKMDPYELAYLKYIIETPEPLTREEYMYLVNFVERLQEMSLARRDQYLKTLNDKKVLTSPNFYSLVNYVKRKSKKFQSQKLVELMAHLETLLDIGPCIAPPKEIKVRKEERVTEIDIDALKVQKALYALMKGGIPNIVRLMDLKKFLNDIMHLNAEQLEQTLNQLKNLQLISLEQFKFMQEFMGKEQLEGTNEQKQLLMKTLQKVASTPPSTAPGAVLAAAPSKGLKAVDTSKSPTTTGETKSKEKDVTSKEGTKKDKEDKIGEKDNKKESNEKDKANKENIKNNTEKSKDKEEEKSKEGKEKTKEKSKKSKGK